MVAYAPSARESLGILNLEADYFFLRNTSVNLHLQGFYFDQPGPNALAIGPAITLRHDFFVRPKGNLFVAGGVGAIYADHSVPEILGSQLNLAPRAAVGFTRELFGNTRLVGGLRVSNIDSLSGPPFSRTVLQPFLGLSIPLR